MGKEISKERVSGLRTFLKSLGRRARLSRSLFWDKKTGREKRNSRWIELAMCFEVDDVRR